MKSKINRILLSSIICIVAVALGTSNAMAASVKFNKVVSQLLNSAIPTDVNLADCLGFSDLNPGKCDDLSFTNSLWGYGQPAFSIYLNGTMSGPNGVPVTPPPEGSEDPKNLVDLVVKWNANTPINPFVGADPLFLYAVPLCVYVEKDDQGAKLAVIRAGIRGIFPGVEEYALLVLTQDQNGQVMLGRSGGSVGTTCTVADAENSTVALTPGLPPLPPEYMSDNIFNLLTPITSGSISLKK